MAVGIPGICSYKQLQQDNVHMLIHQEHVISLVHMQGKKLNGCSIPFEFFVQ